MWEELMEEVCIYIRLYILDILDISMDVLYISVCVCVWVCGRSSWRRYVYILDIYIRYIIYKYGCIIYKCVCVCVCVCMWVCHVWMSCVCVCVRACVRV